MVKHLLLIGAMSIAVPAMAQTGQTTTGTSTSQAGAPSSGQQSLPPTATARGGTQGTTQTPQSSQAPQSSQSPQASQSTQSSQAASPTQIAQVVEQDFPKYAGGKDALTQTQFGAWMASLRSATEPGVTADSPEMKTWITQAFTQADTDKSKSVSRAELTAFLTQAAG
jgi:hypothetical protein